MQLDAGNLDANRMSKVRDDYRMDNRVKAILSVDKSLGTTAIAYIECYVNTGQVYGDKISLTQDGAHLEGCSRFWRDP